MNTPRINLDFIAEMSEAKDRSHLSEDLELAAEIGKNLLERNKELEILLKSSHQYLEEQSLKNEFLSKQLDTLREVNDNRLKAFEQMETTAMDLQRANKHLQSETYSMKKRYKDLAEMVENMEMKCEDYRVEIEELQRERAKLQKELSMALSVREPEQEDEENGAIEVLTQSEIRQDRDEKEKELELLNERISNLKAQHSMETQRREELEYELSELINDNQHLEGQLREFAKQAEEWQHVAAKHSAPERAIDILSDTTKEHDLSNDDIPDDDSFVVVEEELSRQTSTVSDQSAVIVLSPSDEAAAAAGISSENSASFFFELDNQYHELVRKYDALLDKCRSEGLGTNSARIPMVQRAVQVSPMPSPIDERPRFGLASSAVGSDSLDSEQTACRYKKMFEEIYSKLEESKNYRPTTPQKGMDKEIGSE